MAQNFTQLDVGGDSNVNPNDPMIRYEENVLSGIGKQWSNGLKQEGIDGHWVVCQDSTLTTPYLDISPSQTGVANSLVSMPGSLSVGGTIAGNAKVSLNNPIMNGNIASIATDQIAIQASALNVQALYARNFGVGGSITDNQDGTYTIYVGPTSPTDTNYIAGNTVSVYNDMFLLGPVVCLNFQNIANNSTLNNSIGYIKTVDVNANTLTFYASASIGTGAIISPLNPDAMFFNVVSNIQSTGSGLYVRSAHFSEDPLHALNTDATLVYNNHLTAWDSNINLNFTSPYGSDITNAGGNINIKAAGDLFFKSSLSTDTFNTPTTIYMDDHSVNFIPNQHIVNPYINVQGNKNPNLFFINQLATDPILMSIADCGYSGSDDTAPFIIRLYTEPIPPISFSVNQAVNITDCTHDAYNINNYTIVSITTDPPPYTLIVTNVNMPPYDGTGAIIPNTAIFGGGYVYASAINNEYVSIGTNMQGMTDPSSGYAMLTVNGNIYAPSYVTVSDRTYKKNIESIASDTALQKINKIRPVMYDWRVDEFPERKMSSSKDIGFIAQELKEVIPELVKGEKDGDYSVEYQKLVTHLVGAVQELTKRCDNLQAQVDAHSINK